VLVGIGTALKDNPGLMANMKPNNVILSKAKNLIKNDNETLHCVRWTRSLRVQGDSHGNPIRVILDSKARLPLNSKLVKTLAQGPVWVLAADSALKSRVAGLEKKGVRVFSVPARKGHPPDLASRAGLDFKAALKTLVKNGINKLMIEGGPEVLASAFRNKAVDEVYCFIAPKTLSDKNIGAGIFGVAKSLQLNDITVKYLKPDALVHGYV